MTPLGGKACVLGHLPSSSRGTQLCAHVRGHLPGPRVLERFPLCLAPLPALLPGSLAATRFLGPAALVCDMRGLKPSSPLIRPCVGLPTSGLSLLCFLPGATRITCCRGGLHAASARPTGHYHTAASYLRAEFRAWRTPHESPGRLPLSYSQQDTLDLRGPRVASNTGIWVK